MDNPKNDHYYVGKIRDSLRFIVEHMRGTELEDLSKDEVLQDSMMFRLIQISENARRLSDDYRAQHPEIPWIAIFGLRNRIVHDYGNVDLTVVYETLIKDIPELLDILDSID